MMQHQYWVTKKTVLKKLGTKEDECIVSSDSELDAKLELFRSISDSCLQLQKTLDQYQDRLCILAQEENGLGKFLRDAGKGNDASGRLMVSAGKAISYSGQQRLSVRGPLLRLYNEVETFRGRAVSDMRSTVSAMEKARIEYRAALSWMKSTSAQLDPDTGRGLDNFRKAQRQVRESKKVFDKLKLDVLQKIDLLAAARCNMFSHVLANYQTSFITFATKVSDTLTTTADAMDAAPQYEFSILKELGPNLNDDLKDVPAQDKDQMLFFQDEYKDEDTKNKDEKPKPNEPKKSSENPQTTPSNDEEPLVSSTLIDTSLQEEAKLETSGISQDLLGLQLGSGDMSSAIGQCLSSQLIQNMSSTGLLDKPMATTSNAPAPKPTQPNLAKPKPLPTKTDKAAWFKLFAELDPLANPDSIPGANSNQSHNA